MAVFHIAQVAEQFVHIGFAVVLHIGSICVAGRAHARVHAQSADFEAAVVGKTIQIVVDLDIFGLLHSIFGKGKSRLRYVDIASDVSQREYFDFLVEFGVDFFQYGPDLFNLVSVVCCKNQLFHIYNVVITPCQ